MLFHIFSNQEERRNYGGSAFIEMQFCKLPVKTKRKDLVKRIDFWKNDSLYIDDEEAFFHEYSNIFNCGMYSNLKSGGVDLYGVNYYAPNFIEPIIRRLKEEKTAEYEIVIEWLDKAKRYNGFYILGI